MITAAPPDLESIDIAFRRASGRDRPLTQVELLRLSAQQAQALIFAKDRIERRIANTMWMRSATFDISTIAPSMN